MKCIKYTEIYFKQKNRLTLFWLQKFLGHIFWVPKLLHWSPKASSYSPQCGLVHASYLIDSFYSSLHLMLTLSLPALLTPVKKFHILPLWATVDVVQKKRNRKMIKKFFIVFLSNLWYSAILSCTKYNIF